MRNERAAVLVRLVVPAAVVGVGSAVALVALSVAANQLEDLLWDTLPDALGVSPDASAWVIGLLTLTGFVAGVIVWLAPGHAGPDPATQTLLSPPLPASVAPGLALAIVVTLAGGVSLGPENPIMAINVALTLWLGGRARAGIAPPTWVGFAAAGTIGAMFGTPVGAALVLSESPAAPGEVNTWDRLFAPLVAAAAGALTMDAFGQPALSVAVGPYLGARWRDLFTATAVALVAAGAGLVVVYAFPVLHHTFHRLTHPVAQLTAGGLVLGVLGAIGGPLTLFKGLDEMQALVGQTTSDGRLTVIVVVKLAALVVAASSGFRGGRIFPAVFVGVALGLLAHQLVDVVPIALAISAAILGILLVVTRSGWLSLFMAVTIVGQVAVLPVLCIALLPVWLLVTDRPELVIEPSAAP